MKVKEILVQLKSLSNEKMFAHNLKHGATEDNQFGVKMGDIRIVAKKLKADNELALKLWETKILEARLVAILLMKPKELDLVQIDALAKSQDFVQVADWFNAYILKNFPQKEQLTEKWMNASNIWLARSGWYSPSETPKTGFSDRRKTRYLQRLSCIKRMYFSICADLD